MSANVEVKARCGDLAALRRRAERLATRHLGVDRQVDTYFRTRAGRLKLRESSLSGGQLVPYVRPDGDGARVSDYQVIPVPDPEAARRLLAELLGVHRVVRKEREIFLWHNVRIHLDRVEGLGSFMELEAVFDGRPESEPDERRKVAHLLKELGVGEADLVPVSYEALLDEPAAEAP
jgi:predicted adenylyl cyclase CyaB